MTNYRYFIFALVSLSYVLVFFHRLCPAVLATDLQTTFGVSGTLLGVLGSAYFYPYAMMQLPVGVLADSWGPRKMISTFFMVAAAGSILMGMSPNLVMAILGRILVGFGVSALFVSNFKLLAEWFLPRDFVVMGGIFMTVGGIGALSSSVPLVWANSILGWRVTLVIIGLVTLIMAFLVLVFVRDRPSEMGLPCIADGRAGQPDVKRGLFEGLKMVIGSARFWPPAVWSFFVVGTVFAFGGLWGGPYLMDVYRLSNLAAGGVLSTFAFALIGGAPFVSWLANRIGRKTVLVGCSAVLLVICTIFYAFTDRLTLPMLYGLFLGFFLVGAPASPVVTAVAKELFPVTIAGSSVGAVNVFPFLGAAVIQVAVGALLTWSMEGTNPVQLAYSPACYRNMFLLYMMGAAVSLVAALFIRETIGGLDADRDNRLESA